MINVPVTSTLYMTMNMLLNFFLELSHHSYHRIYNLQCKDHKCDGFLSLVLSLCFSIAFL